MLYKTLIGNHGYFINIIKTFGHKQQNCFFHFSHKLRRPNVVNYINNYFPKNIVFFGSDNFSLKSLKALCLKKQEGVIENLHVVSQFKKPYSPIALFCMKSDLPFSEWPLKTSLGNFDMGVVVSFGYLLPQDVIKAFPLGILNVHGSLLPRWRGSSPIVHAILNGDKETGITIMNIHPLKFDVGEIVYQEKLSIEKNMKSLKLTENMAELGAKCLIHSLSNVKELLNNATPQPSIGITNALKIKKEDCEILWDQMTPDVINSMFLAFDDYFPLRSRWHGNLVKLKELSNWKFEEKPFSANEKGLTMYRFLKKLRKESRKKIQDIEEEIELDEKSANNFGHVVFRKSENVLRIKCLGGYVDFKQISVAGKKKMSALDFKNGFISKLNFKKHYFY